MKIKNFLIEWMKDTVKRFPSVYFRYYYDQGENVYYVGVYPCSFVECCEEYCAAENDFSLRLNKAYPDDTVLFESEESLFSLPVYAEEICNRRSGDDREILQLPPRMNFEQKDTFYPISYTNYYTAA